MAVNPEGDGVKLNDVVVELWGDQHGQLSHRTGGLASMGADRSAPLKNNE